MADLGLAPEAGANGLQSTRRDVRTGGADKTRAAQFAGANELLRVVIGNDRWLTQRAIDYAKDTGYARYTTTIWAAWEEAVHALSKSLTAFVTGSEQARMVGPETDYRLLPDFADLVRIGRIHRAIGITFQHFLGLMKYFRLTYLDLIDRTVADGDDRRALRAVIHSFFDQSELAVCSDWAETSDDQRVDELQRRTRALSLEKDKYLTIFESLREPAFVLDPKRRVVNANHAANQLFGAGGEPGELYYAQQRRRTCARFAPLVAILEDHDGAPVWLKTRGGRRCFDVREKPIHDPCANTALGAVLILHDVTDHQKALQESQSAERAKSAFLATVTHEIRTPLNGILGAAELLKSASEERRDAYVGAIEIAGKRLLSTLNQVLDYSKLEAGAFGARIEPVRMHECLREFEQFAAAWAEHHGIDLVVHFPDDLPAVLLLDRDRVHQILINLVSNAIKYDRSGCIDIKVRYDAAAVAPSGVLTFKVLDGGPGIGDEIAGRLFEPFVQADGGRVEAGTGLGLAICRKIVDSLGGHLGYENRDGGGACFRFSIPAEPVSDRPPQPAPADDTELGHSRRAPATILLVDDDSINRLVAADILSAAGHRVLCAESGTEAVNLSRRCRFDLALVDYALPDISGADVAEAIVHDAAMAGRPGPAVIAYTANAERLHQDGAASRFADIWPKPIDRNSLLRAVDRYLPSKRGDSDTTPDPPAADRANLTPDRAGLFLDTYGPQIEPFLTGLTRDEPGVLVEQAHRMASATGILGFGDLSDALVALEDEIRSGGGSIDGAAWAARLQPLFGSARDDLRTAADAARGR